MAQRFGGKYSPQNAARRTGEAVKSAVAAPARVDPVGARANLMFLPAIVLLVAGLFKGAVGLTIALGGAGLLALGAWLLRGGLQAEAAYAARKVARRPALPRKIAAAGLAGLGVAAAGVAHDNGLIAAGLFGIITAALHLAAFGIDPLSDKGMDGIDSFQQDRVARVVDEAEAYLAAMTEALRRAGDRHVMDRMVGFQRTVRQLIRTVEDDPRDLTAARKYLGVYLMGARDASLKFADLSSRGPNPGAREDYLALLDDLEANFAAKQERLLLDDHSDLTVEIEVLRDRLKREGLSPESR
jgi:hypothetical protein